jgi:3-oxoacyl-[acyl-carrier protein] reductase
MPGRLDGKTALVTGGARGIGEAIARAFVREGVAVAILDRQIGPAKTTADTLAANGAKVIAVAADVSNEAEVESAVKDAAKALGHIDILVNNAGIDTTSLVAEMSTAMWDEMMAINLRGVFLCTRAVLPGMIARKFGRIISTSSQLAHKGAPRSKTSSSGCKRPRTIKT